MKQVALLFVALLFALAGCASLESLKDGSSEPEEAASSSASALQKIGPVLTVDCGLKKESVEKSVRLSECKARVSAMTDELDRRFPDLIPISPSDVAYDEAQTCLDSFVSGQEASDCAFFHVSAKVPLRWRGKATPD